MKTFSVDNIYLEKKDYLNGQKLFSSKIKDSVWDNLSKTTNNGKILYGEWTIHKKVKESS